MDLKNGPVRVIIGTQGFGGGKLERSLGDTREGTPRTAGGRHGSPRQSRDVYHYGSGHEPGEPLGSGRVPDDSVVPGGEGVDIGG